MASSMTFLTKFCTVLCCKKESAHHVFFAFSSSFCLHPAGATIEGNDLSLYYGDVAQLTTVTKSRKFLPSDLYGKLVRDCVVCCVDCLLVRTSKEDKKECLLVLRSSEPAKGLWWLPGGRLLKGESFFAAAERKAKEETGLANVTCIQVLGVWNTFFPTSNWDTDTEKGTQTVNPIVLVELNDVDADVRLDDTSEQVRFLLAVSTMTYFNIVIFSPFLPRMQSWNSLAT
jgi:colanic acid biosynthesis protein WcaH